MMNKLAELVKGESVAAWLLIAALVAYFIYKEWPEFQRRITQGPLKDQMEETETRTVEKRLEEIEKDTKEIKEKLDRDYHRINSLEAQMDRTKNTQADLMEELEIIMRALLGVLRGLQEKGSNGPTKEAEAEIQDYLTKKAHKQTAR